MRITYYVFILMITISSTACRQNPGPAAYTETKQGLSPDRRFGDLFVAVQMNQVFPDGKTFVDCVPRFSTDQIMDEYAAAKDQPGFDLKAFVEEHFIVPDLLASGFVSDLNQSAVEHINTLWPVLTRQPDADDAGSLIPLPHPYVVPGGRFREIYYWDSYFTMLGLRAAGRVDMIRNMVDNFAYLIDTIGFIPNGNRTYFLTRSQPPFFPLMVSLLAEEQGDTILVHYLPQLQREYDFWMNGLAEVSADNPAVKKVVRLQDGSILNRYWDAGDTPRPESYREDVETAARSGRDRAVVYRHLRSAAESGWDFSSRWQTDPKDLATIHTNDIIPVDLNSLLCYMEQTLARASRLDNNQEQADLFQQRADQRKQALLQYCWNPQAGYFLDYDFVAQRNTDAITLAALFPLFFQLAEKEQAQQVAGIVRQRLLQAGGVLTTTENTGEQWDAPNGWAPLQWITIQGLRRYGQEELAHTLRQRWTELNLRVYQHTGKMVEKYNVVDMGLDAGGGEYPVQDGFGWTNGVLLQLLTETKSE